MLVAGEDPGDALRDVPGAMFAVRADRAGATERVADRLEVFREDVRGPDVRVDLPGEPDGECPAGPFPRSSRDLRDTGPAGRGPDARTGKPACPGDEIDGVEDRVEPESADACCGAVHAGGAED